MTTVQMTNSVAWSFDVSGVYGMWNMYTIALLCLYAPSHKVMSTSGEFPSKVCKQLDYFLLMMLVFVVGFDAG